MQGDHPFFLDAGVVRTGERTCLLCKKPVGTGESYGGYCFRCLLVPALESDGADDKDWAHRFDPYEILAHPDGSYIELGRGSMGITYQALDTNLQFPVALKVIDLRVAGRETNRERFLREARAAARLRHPHVATVLYYGARQDGHCFYAMELVEGETLAERVQRNGPLGIKEAIEVMAQVASALEAAEEFGLVHRDLKPANLMLVNGLGINVKIIDFGLAKVLDDQKRTDEITHDGFIGTPAFASPEQFSGTLIDQRSDYFSLGSTLYYLLTGERPFQVDKVSQLSEQMTDQRSVLNRLRALRVPAPVRELVASLLRPDPRDRPTNGRALVKSIADCQEACSGARSKRIRSKTYWTAFAILTVIVIGAVYFLLPEVSNREAAVKSIAVLPFEDASPAKDDDYFTDGVQDEILTNLAKIADLRVISRRSVQEYRDPLKRPPPQEIGRVLHVRYLLSGAIRHEGDRIRVMVQLEDVETKRQLWAERYEGTLTDLFAIQTELAEAISQELRVKLSRAEKNSIGEIPTRDLGAYEVYLHAKELLANYDEATQGWDPLDKAVRLLNEAVSRDPNFALAWSQLANAHDSSYWYNEDRTESRCARAESALGRALKLRPDLGEVHLEAGRHLLIAAHDYSAVRRELEIARRTLPNSAPLFRLLAAVESRQGQWKDALHDNEKEVRLNPKDLGLVLKRYQIYQDHRQYQELRKIFNEETATAATAESIGLQKAITDWQERGDTSALHLLLDPPTGPLRAIGRATFIKITCALADRDFAKAENYLATDPSQEFEGGDHLFVCRDYLLGYIKSAEGDTAAAKIAYTSARPQQLAYVQKWPDDPNPLMVLATTDAALGHKEEALAEGRQGVAMEPTSQNAVTGPLLEYDLAEVYLLCGERESAIHLLESLEQTPRALVYGDLAKLPEWEPLRSEPRFQKLLSKLKEPIQIVNRPDQNSK